MPELEASLQFWDEEGFDECIAAAKNLLEKHDLQANLRMRTLLLLAAATLDWDLAEECRLDCETLWHLTRKRFRDHPDEKVHTTLQSLSESLDELGKVQEEEALEMRDRGGRFQPKRYQRQHSIRGHGRRSPQVTRLQGE